MKRGAHIDVTGEKYHNHSNSCTLRWMIPQHIELAIKYCYVQSLIVLPQETKLNNTEGRQMHGEMSSPQNLTLYLVFLSIGC